jgi:hypothetical protein
MMRATENLALVGSTRRPLACSSEYSRACVYRVDMVTLLRARFIRHIQRYLGKRTRHSAPSRIARALPEQTTQLIPMELRLDENSSDYTCATRKSMLLILLCPGTARAPNMHAPHLSCEGIDGYGEVRNAPVMHAPHVSPRTARPWCKRAFFGPRFSRADVPLQRRLRSRRSAQPSAARAWGTRSPPPTSAAAESAFSCAGTGLPLWPTKCRMDLDVALDERGGLQSIRGVS